MPASKTLSAPARSLSLQCLTDASLSAPLEPFRAQKTDLIAELKMSKDITGIKKMKVERAKMENMADKEVYSEFTKQFTADNFVEKIPERDQTGNVIPAWKRQMLAKKAAERARRELEQRLVQEAEQRRLQAIPAWKRQLMAKKEETDRRSSVYTPRVEESRNGFHDTDSWRSRGPHQRAVSIDNISLAVDYEDRHNMRNKENLQDTNGHGEHYCNGDSKTNGYTNGMINGGLTNGSLTNGCSANGSTNGSITNGSTNGKHYGNGKRDDDSDDEIQIIPWRAQLRKTNSKLNLLD